MKITEYKEKYKFDCLAVFDSNTPKYFSEDERDVFEDFLDIEKKENPYFVVKLNNMVVGCGGYEVSGSKAGLTWGMVLNSCHNQQVGTKLLQYRLRQIQPLAEIVLIDTSQYTETFFKKFGFIATNKIQNGYGAGLHKVYMQLKFQS